MEFVTNAIDIKLIQRQSLDIPSVLLENNLNKIDEILRFFTSNSSLLLVNGFMGTAKSLVVKQALKFVNNDVIILNYNCFETTILDDILLRFFDKFKELTAQGIIHSPKVKSENFTQKINDYFESIEKPIVIVINSFEQVLKINKQEILDFLSHLSKSEKVKIVLIGRKFDSSEFTNNYYKVSINALDKSLFEKFLRDEGFKQIGPLSDELYKYTRGYYFYTVLSIKIMQIKKLSLSDFLSGYTKSFQTFNDFILREALSLVDPVSGHLFRFLTIMRHPVSVKLLKTLRLYDEARISYFVENLVLQQDENLLYLQDFYKIISENSIADNIAVKIHKSCVDLYETQLPLKPLERDLLLSRKTMRSEMEYHSLFIPKKPVLPQKSLTNIQLEQAILSPQAILPPQTKQEKEEQMKKISFVFESEADEIAIMNKIASSINKFVDISDKKSKALEEIKDLSLTELVNLAKKAEQAFEFSKAIIIYQKALTLNKDDDYYTYLPVLYSKMASAFKNLSDWFNALKYYELAVEFYFSTGDMEKVNEYRYEIANIYYITFKQEKAEFILKEILSEENNINLQIKAELLLSTITNKKIALPNSIDGVEKSVLAELYFKYALDCDEQGDVENSIKYYKKCVETSQDVKINAYLSSALSNLATIFDENNKTDLAIRYLQESLRLDELSNNHNGMYLSSMKLAEIQLVKNPEKALSYMKKAYNCANEIGDAFYEVSSLLAIGDFYYNKKDYDNALNHFLKALNIAKKDLSEENVQKIQLRIDDIKKVRNE